jgi:Outer membrane protein beta-barrel domain
MKKQILLSLVALSATTMYATAQVKFGVKAGVNLANWQGDAVNTLNDAVGFTSGVLTTKMKPGLHAGGYANIPLSSRISVEPGVIYSQKGYEIKGSLDFKDFEFISAVSRVQSHYIDIPVMLKAEVAKGFTVYAGPQVSYLVHSNLRAEAGVLGFSLLNKNIDISDGFKRFDVGIAGGAGYKFANGVNISAGYDYGLSRIDRNSRFKAYNRVAKVSVGFEF